MKQYLDEQQTANLIELGFEKPKSIIDVWAHETEIDMEYEYEFGYSIGELFKILPKNILYSRDNRLKFYLTVRFLQIGQWYVDYETGDSALYYVIKNELIDALYDMAVKLKKEEII